MVPPRLDLFTVPSDVINLKVQRHPRHQAEFRDPSRLQIRDYSSHDRSQNHQHAVLISLPFYRWVSGSTYLSIAMFSHRENLGQVLWRCFVRHCCSRAHSVAPCGVRLTLSLTRYTDGVALTSPDHCVGFSYFDDASMSCRALSICLGTVLRSFWLKECANPPP